MTPWSSKTSWLLREVHFRQLLPPKYPAALQTLDDRDTYEHVRRKFGESTPDLEWIEALAREGGWVLISHDKLWRVPQQKEALRRAQLVSFFLNDGWEHLTLMIKMQKLLGIWEKLRDTAGRARPGQCFKVPSSGKNIVDFRI